MLNFVLRKNILRSFFKIELTQKERETGNTAINKRYLPTLRYSLVCILLIIPATVLFETTVLLGVLIPVAMVTGTAWFAISLANVKEKFESLGVILTTSIFKSFISSLLILFLLILISFFPDLKNQLSVYASSFPWFENTAALIGVLTVGSIIWNLIKGSIQYDINDSMLTGQHEIAELYFRKSLSYLHRAAENLQSGKDLSVANYYLGLSFFDVFRRISLAGVKAEEINDQMLKAEELKKNPNITQKDADLICKNFIAIFIKFCGKPENERADALLTEIKKEHEILLENTNEKQALVDTRFALIIDNIAELIALEGPALFKK